MLYGFIFFFFFQAEDGIRDPLVTGVQTCALPISRCQEIRALPIDAAVESLALAALAPDRLALAVAAWREFEEEARLLERQWSLRRERAHYEAERARRQYDAVEPENRLVARSLERAWEARLREVEQIEAEYQSWRREQPTSLSAAERAQVISLGEDCKGVKV